MFASIRHHRLLRGSMEELMTLVDDRFADQLTMRPGFVSYEFVDCGEGEVVTVSIFREEIEAERSRDLAEEWSRENLMDFTFHRLEALRGEIIVSRATQDLLVPSHPEFAHKAASLRRYRLHAGSIGELMHLVDTEFAGWMEQMEGFDAYHALDCGKGEIVTVSVFADRGAADESDRRAREFVRQRLGVFDIEATKALGGAVMVSRAVSRVLEPAHA
jgi:hypothetical protein